ncbi:MAG: glycosyltransferase [Lachnospiraceae bacterium]|nr:glycosyltransferase [Lachnospiraceae bacterium]MDY4970847.1 glycosyltransferase [Lachnospiraceae bacterium]
MNITVSIIVPVYNAEEFLNRCIDSILHQEYTDFELILVDDGSSDSSGEICDHYAAEDSRVVVIHKKNSGVSDSRNAALDCARGKYIQFLDSDDWITPDATKLFVRSAETSGCDMVIADFYRVVGERVSHKGDIEEDGVMNREQYAAHMMENPADFYYGVIWNKLFRRDIIEKHHIRMDTELNWCEDFLFNLEYIRHSNSFLALQAPVYYYVKRKGSLVSQSMSINRVIKTKLLIFEYYNEFYKSVYEEEDYSKIRLQVYSFLLSTAKDNMVPPAPLAGSKKLGKERISTLNREAIAGDGIPMELYRCRKLLERHCESVALKHDLSMAETLVLLHLSQPVEIEKIEELADFAGLSTRKTYRILQRLIRRELLQIKKLRTDELQHFDLLPAAKPIIEDLRLAQEDFDRHRFQNLSDDELRSYRELNNKVKSGMLQVLK